MSFREVRLPLTAFAFTYLASACGDGSQANLGPKGDLFYAQADASAAQSDAGAVDASAADDSAVDAAGSDPVSGDAGATGLPCEVDALLQQSCRSCHGSKPIASAPMSLVSYEDLAAPSASDPTKTYAVRSLEEMQAGTMPIGKPLASADYASFAAWLQAGMPRGSCGSDAGTSASDPYDTPVTCSSNKHWTGGERGSPLMHPGRACIDCHAGTEGPAFSIAGTLFLTAHEPNDCNGSSDRAATVVITDAAGQVFMLAPNAAGNFYLEDAIKKPYTAELQYQGRTRAMATPQLSGDCNSCHTQDGTKDAPGRIMLP